MFIALPPSLSSPVRTLLKSLTKIHGKECEAAMVDKFSQRSFLLGFLGQA